MLRTKCSVRSFQCRTLKVQRFGTTKPVNQRICSENDLIVSILHVPIATRSFSNIKKAFLQEKHNTVTEEDKFFLKGTLSRSIDLNPSKDVYNKVMSLQHSQKILDLVNRGQLEEAESFWLDIKRKAGQEGFPPVGIEVYEQVIKMYGKLGKMEELQMTWQEMQDNGIVPSEQLYSAFLLALSSQQMMEEAEEVCKLMLEANVPHTYLTYHAMIKGYLDCRKPEQASVWHQKMKAQGLEENEVTYNIFMTYMKDIGKYHNVFILLNQMKSYDIKPTQRTYAIILQTLAKEDKLDEMIRVFKEMQRVMTPTRVQFNIMLTALGKAGLTAVLTQLFKEMKTQYGIKPTSMDYLAVINGYGKKGMIHAMQTTFDEMLKFGVQPTSHIMTALIDGAGTHGTIEKVEEYMKLMVDLGIPFELSTYEVLLKIYGSNGDTETMEKIFEAMKTLAPKRTSQSYNTVISHLVAAKEYKKAIEYYQKMIADNLEPFVPTEANILKSYLELEDKEKIKEMLKKHIEDKEYISELGQAFRNLFPFEERNLNQRKFDQYVKKLTSKDKTTTEEM